MRKIYKIKVIRGDAESLIYDDIQRNIILKIKRNFNNEVITMDSVELIQLLDEDNIKRVNPEWEWTFNSDLSAALTYGVFGLLGSLFFNHLRSFTKYVGIKLKDGRTFLCVMSEDIYDKMRLK